MKKCNNRSRAGLKGKDIYCPHCNTVKHVYHFNWCASQCNKCGKMQDKNDWQLEPSDSVNLKAHADVLLWQTYYKLGLTSSSRLGRLVRRSIIGCQTNSKIKNALVRLIKSGFRVDFEPDTRTDFEPDTK